MQIKNLLQHFVLFSAAMLLSVSMFAQTINVSGTVTDNNDLPVIGASVMVPGTTVGTVTDLNGKYVLNGVDSKGTLQFSSIGYATITVAINGKSVVDAVLAEENEQLEETVVVGYAVGNKRSVSGTVERVRAEDMNTGYVSSPIDAIRGKVAGLVMSNTGGSLGTPTIRLRGTSSLSGGSEPLVIIDGVFSSISALSQLSAQDIAEMTVLKDASETAQYGSRGAAGVIVVQTVRGEEGRASVSYNGQFGISQKYKTIEMLSADEYRQYGAGALSSDLGASTNWFEWIQNPIVFQNNHNISLSQGTTRSNMRASIGINDRNGLVRGTKNTNYTSRFNATQNAFNNKLKMEMNLSANYRTNHSNGSPLAGALIYNPTYPDHRNPETGIWDIDSNVATMTTHPGESLESETVGENIGVTASGRITYTIVKGLTASLFGSFDYSSNVSKSYTPNDLYSSRSSRGSASVSNSNSRNWMTSFQINYNKEIGKHSINALAVGEAQDYFSFSSGASASGFDTNYFKYYNLGAGAVVQYGDVSSSASGNRLLSAMARFNYMYDNKYVITLNARTDGSSKLGANHKWGFFPSASIAWVMSNEGFMKDQDLFSTVKWRVGYGVTGNQNSISALNSLMMLQPNGTTTYNGASTVTYGITSNSNPDLKWEMKYTFDAGVDFTMLKGRLRGVFDYYRSRTTDLLYNYKVSVPPFTYNTLLANMGEMTNNGFELSLTGDIIKTKDMKLTVSANGAINKNKLVSLHGTYKGEELTTSKWVTLASASGQGLTSNTGVTYMSEGYPVGLFRLPVSEGFTTNDKGQNVYKLKDINGDGTVDMSDDGDREILGQVIPKFTSNLSISFNYKKFDISAQLNGAFGHSIYNFTSNSLSYMGNFPVMNVLKTAPELNLYEFYNTSYWLEKGDYVNLEYITVGYNFTKALRGFQNARLAISCNNIGTITGYSGLTPMINSQSINGGIDARNVSPIMRTYTMQLVLTF